MIAYLEQRLGNICKRFSSGKGISANSIFEAGDYPVLGGNGLRGFTDTYNFDGECAVIGRQGAYCGNVQFFAGKGYMTEHAIVAQPDDRNNAKYLTYKLAGLQLGRFSGQAAQPGLSVTKLARLRIEMPSKEYQDRVASILSTYDDLIEINNRRIKALEQMAENLYKEWFVRFRYPGHETAEFEDGIPKGWEIVKVKEIVKRLPFGTLYKTEDTEKDGRVIVIDQSQSDYVGFHNNEPSHFATPLSPIALFGDHSCKQQLMITPFSLSENIIPFKGKTGVNTVYLYYLTYGLIETTEYKRHWTEFIAKKVLLAPVELQECFADKVTKICEALQRRKEQNRNLIKQRDLLLPRLMSGKLEVHT